MPDAKKPLTREEWRGVAEFILCCEEQANAGKLAQAHRAGAAAADAFGREPDCYRCDRCTRLISHGQLVLDWHFICGGFGRDVCGGTFLARYTGPGGD